METPHPGAPSRAAFGLLALGLLLICPLAFSRAYADQFTTLKLLLTKGLLLSGAVMFGLGLIWRRHRWPRNSCLTAPFAALALAVLISCLTSPLPGFSLLEAECFLTGPLWLGLLMMWGGGEAWVRRLAAFAAIAGAIVAAIALIQWTGRDPLLFGGYHVDWGTMPSAMRLYSTFGNPNLVAGYLIGPVFLTLALAESSKKLAGRILGAVAALVIFAAILGTRSRGAWLGLAAGLLVARPICPRRVEAPASESAGSRTSPMLGAILAPAGWFFLAPDLALQMEALISHLAGRFYLCRAGWPMFTEHPLFGSGWGMFQLRFLELQAQFLSSHPEYVRHWTHTRQLHNDPLQILFEAGALGFGALGWLLWSYGREVRLLLLRASRTERLWLAASSGGVTAILTDSLFNFQLSVSPTLILLFTLLAVPQMLKGDDPAGSKEVATTKSSAALRGVASGAVVAAALLLALGMVRNARAEHSFAQGLEQERIGRGAAAEQNFRAGIMNAAGDGRLHYGLARALSMQEQYSAALAETLAAERTISDSHLEVLKARIQDQMGLRTAALETYRHALWLDPTLKSVRADIERLSK